MEADLLLQTYLKRLRLPVVAQSYRRVAEEAARTNQSYQRYLLALAEADAAYEEPRAAGCRRYPDDSIRIHHLRHGRQA